MASGSSINILFFSLNIDCSIKKEIRFEQCIATKTDGRREKGYEEGGRRSARGQGASLSERELDVVVIDVRKPHVVGRTALGEYDDGRETVPRGGGREVALVEGLRIGGAVDLKMVLGVVGAASHRLDLMIDRGRECDTAVVVVRRDFHAEGEWSYPYSHRGLTARIAAAEGVVPPSGIGVVRPIQSTCRSH